MSVEPDDPFTKLEAFGDDDAAVCGPDGCALPPDHDAVAVAETEPDPGSVSNSDRSGPQG